MLPIINKAKDVVSKGYSSISPERKRMIGFVLVVIVLVMFFGQRLIDSVRSLFHKDINKIEVNNRNLTYPKSEYYAMCSTLESAMQYSGTDEDSILDIMRRIKNLDDWNFLQKAFGKRKKDGGTFYADITGDLKMWINDELNSSKMKETKSILKENGVEY